MFPTLPDRYKHAMGWVVGFSFLPPALLALTLVCVLVMRGRSITFQISTELILLAMLGGFLLLRDTSPLPIAKELPAGIPGAWLRALAVVWWLVGARLVARVTVIALGRDARSRQARLFSDLVAGAIYLTAALIVLNSVLDVPVKGLLATSGVIAVVIGLALQNTLADVFAGIAVGLEQPFHVGDRVTVGDYAEGIIVQINWRSIQIQTDGEDLATIPNSIVAKSQIINRSVPTERRAASVEITTASAARSETLMALMRQAVLLCTGILEQPASSITLKRVGTRTTTFSVNFFVATSGQMSSTKSQLLRQVRRLFRHAGIGDGAPPSSTSLLGGLALFEALTGDQLAVLAEGLIPRVLDPGDRIFDQGSKGASLYIVQAGILEIRRRDSDGQTKSLGRIGPGEYLGEISLMTGDPRPVSVVALTACDYLELPRTALEKLMEENLEVCVALERSVRRGLDLLDRDDAARSSHPLDEGGTLLGRIRKFFRLPAHSA